MNVGRYHLDRLLGEGGMGSVHAGTHSVTGRKVAIKLLRPEVAAVPGVHQRFLTEARAACAVDHPHVVDVLDVDVTADGQLYMVLELLDGEALDTRLQRGPLSPKELWQLAEPLLDALQRAHERGVVHRDIKPANVFLAQDRTGRKVPKLLDFGIAKLLEGDDPSVTASGHLLGTPLYLPPEHVRGAKEATPAGDVYSFAALCYEALSGVPPHPAKTLPELLLSIVSKTPPPLVERGVSPALSETIAAGLARDPADRPPSAAAFAERLRVAVESAEDAPALETPDALALTGAAANHVLPKTTPGAPLPVLPPPRRNLAWLALPAALLIALVGYVSTRSDEVPTSEPTRLTPSPVHASPRASAEAGVATTEDLHEDPNEGGDSNESGDSDEASNEPAEATTTTVRRNTTNHPATRETASSHTNAPTSEPVDDPAMNAPTHEPATTMTETPPAPAPEPVVVEGIRSGGLRADEF
ncbi:MAG: serine/threonine protein kinase [Sandaracinus sp.]|nr:serine/threonine protein kinase [Sandaracinus sp.]MCB9616259.1 serine/threonine protein kinase [Sandaracinus sp.]MCB9617999.1 serine/threonine protein kinase [Sandaracinus sp.]MCB9625582.1 serine/threonine protein kinase [Sandaracinus sp.]MCB9636869.1 serine/threonine protein kinase [Sandaracinus sp.]